MEKHYDIWNEEKKFVDGKTVKVKSFLNIESSLAGAFSEAEATNIISIYSLSKNACE
jgi:hypothetical protein